MLQVLNFIENNFTISDLNRVKINSYLFACCVILFPILQHDVRTFTVALKLILCNGVIESL
jgi:hypothetical protein